MSEKKFLTKIFRPIINNWFQENNINIISGHTKYTYGQNGQIFHNRSFLFSNKSAINVERDVLELLRKNKKKLKK